MANPRKTSSKTRKAPVAREALRDSVFVLTSEMEEPLRHALQMVRLIGLVDPRMTTTRKLSASSPMKRW